MVAASTVRPGLPLLQRLQGSVPTFQRGAAELHRAQPGVPRDEVDPGKGVVELRLEIERGVSGMGGVAEDVSAVGEDAAYGGNTREGAIGGFYMVRSSASRFSAGRDGC